MSERPERTAPSPRRPGRRVLLALLAILCAAGAARADEVDDYVRAQMRRQHIPGLSLVVLRDGKVVKAAGYGLASMEHGAPATPDTVYELASATKPFVATAVMLLAADGKLALDDAASRYLDGAPDAWKGITIRHLLSHTSGIPDYLADLRHDFPHDAPAEDVVRLAMASPLLFAPGERWSYSNTGYVALGMIVERVSGERYDAFLKRRVFGPLGMTRTRRDTPDELVDGRASGYLWYGPGGLHNGDFLRYMMTNHGDRGILSTALDLAKWDAALASDRVLARAAREAMWTPARLNDGSSAGYGFGWFVDTLNGHRHVSHPGGAPGTATIVSRYPDDGLTVVVLANGGAAYPQALDRGIAQRYIPDLGPRGTTRLARPLLDAAAGYYNAYGFQVLKVTREGDTLVLDDNGRLMGAFLPLSETEFVAEDADRGFTLTRGEGGRVTGMTLRLGPDRMPVQRIGPPAGPTAGGRDPDPGATGRAVTVLEAFARGGKAVEAVEGVAPQARKDYARGPSPELAGVRAVAFVASHDAAGSGIERHGAQVARVLYLRATTDAGPRLVLVYVTADGLVTDQDVVAE